MESGVVFCSLFIFCKIYKMYNYFRKKGLQFRKEYDIISKSVEGTPVPIPNTEVKLNGAEDTLLVTTRKNRKMPT